MIIDIHPHIISDDTVKYPITPLGNKRSKWSEERGSLTAEKLIAVHDWRKRNAKKYVYGVLKAFVLCRYKSGGFEENNETTGIDFFSREEIPDNLAAEKCTKEQILMCFDALDNPDLPTQFD